MKVLRQFMFVPLILFIFACLAYAWPSVKLHGYVYNARNGLALPHVNIVINDTLGASTGLDGHFEFILPDGSYRLQVKRIGFESLSYTVNIPEDTCKVLHIDLQPAVLSMKEEITVFAERLEQDPLNPNRNKWLNNTEDIIQRFEGVNLFKRANFASEPSIRGSSMGQISITIDGAKMFYACVDRMDPITAYIEVENLEQAQLSKGSFDLEHNQTIGGSLNFVTEKADYQQSFFLESEGGYESVSALRRFRFKANYSSNNDWAIRLSGSVKKSDAYYAGKNRLIGSSGFNKNNYALSLGKKIGSKSDLHFYYIGDNAWDIGYPALIMDARKTQSHIFNLEYNVKDITPLWNRFSLKLYYNTVKHWMDDYGRSIEEIFNRDVMPGMYMPMYGTSSTSGLIMSFTIADMQNIFTGRLEYYQLAAFADMDMYPIQADKAPAYLINIADARINNAAISLKYNRILSGQSSFRLDARFDYSLRNVLNSYGKRPLQSLYPGSNLQNQYHVFGISANYEYRFNDNISAVFKLGNSQRLPTHLENYGYMLYNVLDNFFYYGNPSLKPERSIQVESGINWKSNKLRWRLTTYASRINDYISGYILEGEFKKYENFSLVYLFGAEGSLSWQVTNSLLFFLSTGYTYGQNTVFNEPLPYIPPAEARLKINYTRERYFFEGEARFAASQNRIAYKTTVEDKTPGFVILNLRSQIILSSQWRLKAGIENILDRYYYEHLSINNLPGKGRNFYLGINYRIN